MLRLPRLAGSTVVALFGVLAASYGPLWGQSGTPNGEWRTYSGDLASTRYAPLDQITRDNFGKLEVA